MSAQDRTLDQYHNWMQVNAASHLIRAGQRLGIFDALRQRQHTAAELVESLSLQPDAAFLLLDALVAIGIVEQYGDDYALSQAAHLLCQYDEDLGDARWECLIDRVSGGSQRETADDRSHFDYLAATQWIHTKAAMQAAEILDIGGEDEVVGPAILDLGCGSAVWSCAMAHRDADASVTAVDLPGALGAASSTAESINMLDRFQTFVGEPLTVELPSNEFDIVLIAQRLSCLDEPTSGQLLERAKDAAKPGGRVIVIDSFRGPTRPNLAECSEALTVHVRTCGGRVRTLEEIQGSMRQAGLENVQFTFLADSKSGLGMAVGSKPA